MTRRQAHLIGVNDDELRSRVMGGSLDIAGEHTFRLFGAPITQRSRLQALILDVGPAAYASGSTLAALLGCGGFELAEPFDVTIERGRQVRREGHHIHTTKRLDAVDRSRVDGIPALSSTRLLVDLARTEPADRLAVALDSLLRDRKLTEDRLHQRIVALRSPGRYGIPKLLEVIEGGEITRGGHSWLERRFLTLAAQPGLPRPDVQQVLAKAGSRLVRVDFRFPSTPIVVETLGYRYHATRAQLIRDAARLNALLDQGLRPYQFTYDQVVDNGATVIAQLRAALQQPAA